VPVAIGAREAVEFRVTADEMEAFRRLSSDLNPLHDDAEFARRRGFDDVVVYGGLIVAQVSRLLGTRLPGHGCVWRSMSLRFRNPLYVGEPAQLSGVVVHANDDLGAIDIKISVTAGGRRIAEGEAAALLVRDRADA
jgi:3-hydroxybutyryl-CoA dehydratase